LKIKILIFRAIFTLIVVHNILYPLSLKLGEKGNARVVVMPLARIIKAQSLLFSDLVASGRDPDILLTFGLPSIILQNGNKIVHGYPTFSGMLDLSLHVSLGVSFFSGRYYDDNINIINPRFMVSVNNELISEGFVIVNFIRTIGPDDFRFFSRDISFIKRFEMEGYSLFIGMTFGELECRNEKLMPFSFKETVVDFQSGVLTRLNSNIFTGFEFKAGKNFLYFNLNFIIII